MIWNPDVETMPRPKLRELQLKRLRWSVRWAYDRVPFHRQRLDAAGVDPDAIRSLDDLRRLPFMVKADLREYYPTGLFAVPRADIVRIHASSGTKGKPTVVGYTREDIDVWAEVCARSLACGGATHESVVHVEHQGVRQLTNIGETLFRLRPFALRPVRLINCQGSRNQQYDPHNRRGRYPRTMTLEKLRGPVRETVRRRRDRQALKVAPHVFRELLDGWVTPLRIDLQCLQRDVVVD